MNLDCTNIGLSKVNNWFKWDSSTIIFFVIEDWKLNIELNCDMNFINIVNAKINIGDSLI